MAKKKILPLTAGPGYNALMPKPVLPLPTLESAGAEEYGNIGYSVADYNSFGNTEQILAGTIETINTEVTVLQNEVVILNDQHNVPIAGGQMTGPLILSGDPSAPNGAATKNYVDSQVSNVEVSIEGNIANAVANLEQSITQTVISVLGVDGGEF